ncbi:unnamed protein product [Acanthoscelides obtectus]|uniref:BRISC and BRCA1-A complex member 1 n=1 Tax=Acanthoscelides obtectus TaxID=200917 RepID=A0A9P0PLU5_ACAOB|nr:unnamed protein product [Acanthoscelides obtectus]CAK1662471.1 BRISC and BRCA1-A complex member 1 [Acanthoscelides obtectus]
MAERIIPIQIEGENEQKENDGINGDDQTASKTLESSSIKPDKPNIQIRRTLKKSQQEEKLQEFDLFEKCCKINLPNANVQEKIILVIDRAQDENPTPFKAKNQTLSPLSMLRRALHIFLELKHDINSNHEFALMTLNENGTSWVTDFSSDIKKLHNAIDQISGCEVEDTFSLDGLFEQIFEKATVCAPKEDEKPNFVVRTIVCWGRSYTLPHIEEAESFSKLLKNPYFICDILITHEPVDPGNHSEKIINILINLIQDIGHKSSYFFPVGRDTARLHLCMARLLGHPSQRPAQKLVSKPEL